jgi:hypothetical protein
MYERAVALVSPYFPPSTLAGVHRARHLAKHLPSVGWRPIVVCVDEAYHEEKLDPELARLVPSEVELIKTKALPISLTRFLGVGDISLRAWKYLKRSLFDILEHRRVNAVLITGSPYYPMLFAPAIKELYRVPIILDFQDPWVSAWGAEQSTLSKAGIAHRLAVALEPRALRGADFVTSVSETQNQEMASRYSWLDTGKMAAIPIGSDPDDFVAMRKRSAALGNEILDPDHLHLSYVGTCLPRSGPLLRTLFRAFKKLHSTTPRLASRIRLNFIGTSNQPNEGSPCRVMPLAETEGVSHAVFELPRRLPYLDALNIIACSQGVLLIGSDEPHYTASKIYPALMSGRPFLSLFHRASSAHAILSEAGGGQAFAFENDRELAALEDAIAKALVTLAESPEILGSADPTAHNTFEARRIAERFGQIFDMVASETVG